MRLFFIIYYNLFVKRKHPKYKFNYSMSLLFFVYFFNIFQEGTQSAKTHFPKKKKKKEVELV